PGRLLPHDARCHQKTVCRHRSALFRPRGRLHSDHPCRLPDRRRSEPGHPRTPRFEAQEKGKEGKGCKARGRRGRKKGTEGREGRRVIVTGGSCKSSCTSMRASLTYENT